MGGLTGIILVSLVLGGLWYFWLKAQLHGFSWLAIIASIAFWPIGALLGLYWGAKDLYYHYQSK
jgi:hypothetical protein